MYLVVQCWIFVYNLEKAAVTDTSNFGPKERTNKLDVLFQPRKHIPVRNCSIPDDWLYPLCKHKLRWMRAMWSVNRGCYVDRHGINPADDCTLLQFFSEVEAWCPILPWRRHLYPYTAGRHKIGPPNVRDDLKELMHKMSDSKYQWMRERITRLWPDWKKAAQALNQEKPAFRNRQVKNVFVYMGAYVQHEEWLGNAYKGWPLGEMLQWSDLIASLYVLGHNVTISAERKVMNRLLGASPNNTDCARRLKKKAFDLIYIDYIGSQHAQLDMGPSRSHYRCNFRILDSFGTDAEFNYAEYEGLEEGSKSPWGSEDVHLRQIMTMFPHSPDNLFLGFVVDKAVTWSTNSFNPATEKDRPIGLLYAKQADYLNGRREFVDFLSRYLEIHATITNNTEGFQTFVPDYVINHGIMKGGDLQRLLRRTKVFIGLGFPYEGTAPLEAISQGCVFINPKFDLPLSRKNTAFFKPKPTFRELTSQHPYMETFIGKPHVYTIDIKNLDLVESTVKEILSSEVKPFLPYEWTPKGMLERVNTFTENLDFCEQRKQWPPLKEMHLVLGSKGNSCKDACAENGFLCEPSFFNYVNSAGHFKTFGVTCENQIKEESLYAPSYTPADRSCTLQAMTLLFSCVAKDSSHMRLCPCRDYQPQQVAFCKNCD